jgi:tyrosinase
VNGTLPAPFQLLPVLTPPRGSLSKSERASYIAAVHCLHNNTTFITPPAQIPGVRNRYDDFVGGHMVVTQFVHNSGFFLPFHRFYLHLYETALRDECGYAGAQPYWDWTLSYTDPRKATVFDGSPWSMGGNGAYVPGREPVTIVAPGFTKTIPPATGGGCVESGPFTADKFVMNLGPVSFEPSGPDGGFGYNPRCVVRDLSPELAGFTRPTNVTAVLGCGDLACFNNELDDPLFGVHGSGHFQVGGIQLDVFASPSDPIFWLHHAQVDRLWTIWQNLGDPQDRTYQVWGTQTSGNGE